MTAEEEDRAPVSSEVSCPDSELGPNAHHPPAREPPDSSWARIKRHKVFEWTLAYVAFGYALLHGVQMLREAFDWPLLVSRLTAVGLVLGTPVAVTLAWFHGHRARPRVSGQELSILIVLLVVAGSVLWWASRPSRERATAPTAVANIPPPSAAAFNPPPHSIAVLPFVNISGDKEQEYFSEGLTEELLNSLSRINELQVAARTSSFSFQGEHPDIATVAHKLNVGAVLEGSVRRSANTVRITTQLVNGVSGFHVWSQTYDRDLGDVLRLQTEIATAVASALKVTLLGDEAARIELGGTRTPGAFDAYLRGRKAYERSNAKAVVMDALAAYTEAIRLDSNYALAFAGRSIAYSRYAWVDTPGAVTREVLDKALADARQALALAPELAEGYLALAIFFAESLDFAKANEAFERAVTLAPGNAWVLRASGGFAANMGHFEASVTALRRAAMLDPLNPRTHAALGNTLYLLRRYQEAVAVATQTMSLDPDYNAYDLLGLAYYGLGDLESARASCEAKPANSPMQCLAVTYDKLGRYADAEAVVTKMKATAGDADAYQYATIYAQWGNTVKALESLNTAIRLRHPDLEFLKTDPLMDPLRKEPRFQAIERELKFPD